MSPLLNPMLADLRTIPRGVWVLVGGQFINRFGSFVHPFLVLYLTGRGLGSGQVATVLAAIAFGHLLAPVVAGFLTDAIGRRDTILVALVGGAITLFALYFCQTHAQLVTMAALHGFLTFMFGPAANALLTDLVKPEQRVTAFALLRLAVNAGFAAGPAVAGVLFTRAPFLIFAGDAATTLVFALLAWLFLPHGLRTIAGRTTSPVVMTRSWIEALADVRYNGPYLQLLVGTVLMAAAFMQVFNVLALDATDRGLSPAAYGVLMGFNGFLIVLFELPLTYLIKPFPSRRLLVIGFSTVGLGCAAFSFASSLPAFLAAMTLFTFGEMLSLPVASGYGSQLAPTRLRGRYFGLNGVVWSIAGLAGSSGVWFYSRLGASWWLWAGAAGLAAGMAMCAPIRDRRTAGVVEPASAAG